MRAIAAGDAPEGVDAAALADYVLTLQAGMSNASRLPLPAAQLRKVAAQGMQAVTGILYR